MPVNSLNLGLMAHKRPAQHYYFATLHNALAHFNHAALIARESIEPSYLVTVQGNEYFVVAKQFGKGRNTA